MENQNQSQLSTDQSIKQPVVSQPTPNKSKSRLVLVVVLFIFLIPIGVYILGAKNINQQKQVTIIPTTAQKLPSSTIAPISNWKIYTNNSGKYAISYPPNWITKEQPISNSNQTPKEVSASFMVMPPVDKTLEFPPIVSIEVFANPEDLSEKVFFIKYIFLVPQDTVTKEVVVDSKKGITISSLGGAVDNDNVLIKYNGNIYKITLDHSLIKEKDIDNKLFNQILSTFRFTN